MLGGPVYIALLRFALGFVGSVLMFSLMSEPRYHRKKMIACYGIFGAILIALACIWYVIDWESCVRMVAFAMYLCFAIFAVFMSSDPVYLSIYKLALTFYLLAVFLISGIEVAIIFFDRNIWADIITRVILVSLMAYFIDKKIKGSIRGFGYYVENELDKFSVSVMIISILFGIGFILNPNIRDEQTPYRLFQILVNFILVGALQLLIFRLYLHIGKEKEYQKENQLMQMNHRLLERNMELLEESVVSSRRIRHDARHHNAVIAEYARREQKEELLQYLEEYDKEMDAHTAENICANTAINNILSAYTRKARNEQIKVTLDVELGGNLAIPNIDLVTILANAYENAIYGCIEVKKRSPERECFIDLMLKRKKNKLVICCKNTCRIETELKNGQPKPEFTGGIGVLSIIKTAEKFDGEYDFKNDDGIFVFRLIMNIPLESGGKSVMYRIALCDDEAAELDKTEQMLKSYEKNHPETALLVERFESADDLLVKIREENYAPDVILLDIYMPEKMGIEAARELRAMGNRGRIVFLTTSKEHALDAFGVEASQYLVKPVSEDILFPILDNLLKETEEGRKKYLLLRINGRLRRVAVSDIVYCEAEGKVQRLYLADDTQYELRRTMAEIYEMLACYREFVRVGIAYIVNLEHVESLSTQELQTDNKKKIYLPRGSYRALRERYFAYYCDSNDIL